MADFFASFCFGPLSRRASISWSVSSYAPSSPFERLKAQNLHLFTQILVGLMWRLTIKKAFSPFFLRAASPASLPRPKKSSLWKRRSASLLVSLPPVRILSRSFFSIDYYSADVLKNGRRLQPVALRLVNYQDAAARSDHRRS